MNEVDIDLITYFYQKDQSFNLFFNFIKLKFIK